MFSAIRFRVEERFGIPLSGSESSRAGKVPRMGICVFFTFTLSKGMLILCFHVLSCILRYDSTCAIRAVLFLY